jgi:hypothetical protein
VLVQDLVDEPSIIVVECGFTPLSNILPVEQIEKKLAEYTISCYYVDG